MKYDVVLRIIYVLTNFSLLVTSCSYFLQLLALHRCNFTREAIMPEEDKSANSTRDVLMNFPSGSAHAGYDVAASRLLQDSSSFSHEIFRRGPMQVKLYAPPSPDPQQPHEQDEIYIIAEGSGEFLLEEEGGDKIIPVTAPDFIFVPAGVVHRFINFSNLKVWVFFY